ncbi:MAG: hypothetical protein SCALA702_20770 [Melioribacteraceae bacterium]|nr:MAG: hypothetical protein SCALA702_20770 [Melioribacteraceae bacterium]
MKKLVIIVLFISFNSFAQITVTQQDLESNYTNTVVTEHSSQDLITASVNLGSASASPQVFDFTNLFSLAPMDTTYALHQNVNGQPGSSSFPFATRLSQQDYDYIQFEMHVYVYYNITEDGMCIEGMVTNQIVPGVMDTLYIQEINPYFLTYPVPLTLGTIRTHIDTMMQVNGVDYAIEEHSWECDGFGELKLDGGNTYQALRVIRTELQRDYEGGVLTEMETDKEIQFWTKEGILVSFDVDTTYNDGSTIPLSADISYPDGTTNVENEEELLPETMVLEQNYPNPFNPETNIRYYLPETAHVSLTVYNVTGELIAELVNREVSSGYHTAQFNSEGLSSGVYFYKLDAGGKTLINKMLLLK